MRPDWDTYFLTLAAVTATRSPCVRRQVGAVLVRENQVLASGYNGPPSGHEHRTTDTCVRIGLKPGERPAESCCVHAEMNALAMAAKHGVSIRGSTLYVTVSPCDWCSKVLLNAGVEKVISSASYPNV